MQLPTFRCRICKTKREYTIITEFGEMPKGIACIRCHGCGVYGIEKIEIDPVQPIDIQGDCV